MKTGLITSDTYQNHNTGDGHPEKIDRVTAVIDNFKKLDNKNLIWKKPNKFENSFLNFDGFFQIRFLLFNLLKLLMITVTLSIFSGCPEPVL